VSPNLHNYVLCPRISGLGIEIDEAVLRRYAV